MSMAYSGLADPRAYVRLAAIVRQQVTDGILKPGQPAPSITRLSQEYGHARPTCGKALRLLEGEKVLTRIPGLGYYVVLAYGGPSQPPLAPNRKPVSGRCIAECFAPTGLTPAEALPGPHPRRSPAHPPAQCASLGCSSV
jgi:DNA-binding transcriptional MocR family regulator